MEKLRNIGFAIVVLALFLGCEKGAENTVISGEYVFGLHHGECMGKECNSTYKIIDGKLYEDTIGSYRGQNGFGFIQSTESKYNIAKSLIAFIPDELKSTTERTFGCPDCADQGTILLELTTEGERVRFFIDTQKNSVPEYLHSFVDEVIRTMELL